MLDLKMPVVTISAVCGRGMYMRSLAHDLGTALKCGGHTSSLIRRGIGPFQLENTIKLDEFAIAVSEGRWREMIHPPDSLLLNLKSATLSATAERDLRNGQSVPLANHARKGEHLEKHRLYSIDGRSSNNSALVEVANFATCPLVKLCPGFADSSRKTPAEAACSASFFETSPG